MADGIWQFILADEIDAAEFRGVDAKVGGGDVEQQFAEEIRLEAPRRAIGADRRLVGVIDRDLEGDIGNAIRPEHELRRLCGNDAAVGARIGAHVGIERAAQPRDPAIVHAGNLEIARDLARMVGRHQMFAAVLDPFHRPLERARNERHQKIFRIKLATHAEPAADFGADQIDLLRRKAEGLGNRGAVVPQHLRRAPHREMAALLVPLGDETTRLHRQRSLAVTAERLAAAIVGTGECGLGIAEADRVARRDVGAVFLKQQRGAARRRFPIHHRRQR